MCNLLGYAQTTYTKLGIILIRFIDQMPHVTQCSMPPPAFAPVAFLHKRVMRQHHPFIAPGGLGAKKKQGSGRSPEIVTVLWPFGLKYKAYKPSC